MNMDILSQEINIGHHFSPSSSQRDCITLPDGMTLVIGNQGRDVTWELYNSNGIIQTIISMDCLTAEKIGKIMLRRS